MTYATSFKSPTPSKSLSYTPAIILSTFMVGADATVAWVNSMGMPNAVDYFLTARVQVEHTLRVHTVVCNHDKLEMHTHACMLFSRACINTVFLEIFVLRLFIFFKVILLQVI